MGTRFDTLKLNINNQLAAYKKSRMKKYSKNLKRGTPTSGKTNIPWIEKPIQLFNCIPFYPLSSRHKTFVLLGQQMLQRVSEFMQ